MGSEYLKEEEVEKSGANADGAKPSLAAANAKAHPSDGAEGGQTDGHFSLRSLRAEAEIYALSKTLEYTGWNRRRAAQLLSISYRGILYKIRQHNLTPRSVPAQTVQQVSELGKAE